MEKNILERGYFSSLRGGGAAAFFFLTLENDAKRGNPLLANFILFFGQSLYLFLAGGYIPQKGGGGGGAIFM